MLLGGAARRGRKKQREAAERGILACVYHLPPFSLTHATFDHLVCPSPLELADSIKLSYCHKRAVINDCHKRAEQVLVCAGLVAGVGYMSMSTGVTVYMADIPDS